MDTPRRISLVPSTVTELLDRTFRIYRENFVSFVGLVAAVIIPVTIINTLAGVWLLDTMQRAGIDMDALSNPGAGTGFGGLDPSSLNTLLGQLIGFYILIIVIAVISAFVQGVLINGPLTYITSEAALGRKVTIGQAFRAAQSRFGALAGGLLVFYLLMFMLLVLVGLSAFVFFLCGLTPGMALYVAITLYAFLTPVLVLERVGALEGVSRAWALAKARFWPMFGLFALVTVITVVLGIVFAVISNVISERIVGPASFTTSTIVQGLLQALTGIVIQPLLPIGFTLVYYDARVRLEGLDIALNNVGTEEPRPSDVQSPPPPGETFSRDDFINMGIIAVGCIILGVLYVFVAGGITSLMMGSLR